MSFIKAMHTMISLSWMYRSEMHIFVSDALCIDILDETKMKENMTCTTSMDDLNHCIFYGDPSVNNDNRSSAFPTNLIIFYQLISLDHQCMIL